MVMSLLLVGLFIVALKIQVYPLVKKSYKKEAATYVFFYLVAAVLLLLVGKNATGISFFLG